MNRDWTEFEVNEIVKDYFEMLSKEIQNIKFNKSIHRSNLKSKLNKRSDGSIEFKHQNISAVLVKFGRPFILGYKPRGNYQNILELSVLNYLETYESSNQNFEYFANTYETFNRPKIDFNNWIKPIPQLEVCEEPNIEYRPRISKVNYIEKEQANRALGEQGEELVIEYEKWRLIKNDKINLADKIEWVSKDLGDGTGFDILSKNVDGTDRYIEVKTTKLSKYTPIYLTRNELSFSREKEDYYHLYRIFEFNKAPKMFNSNGRLDGICNVEPINFIGRFK